MAREAPGRDFRPDVDELILVSDPDYVADTYIFEASREEEKLGSLFAAAETETRGGMGRELLDTTLQALQREYYRDPSRGILTSFESALHQANLILHDITEEGVRDWMGYFHVALGVLAGSTLHISTAGRAQILLIRRSRISVVSAGLSHSPITDPLRAFSHVASGVVVNHDLLLFATSHSEELFRHEDIARFAITHSASTVTLRLRQLYEDQAVQLPVSLLAVSIVPHRHLQPPGARPLPDAATRRTPLSRSTLLTPRQPIVVHRSLLRYFLVLIGRLIVSCVRLVRRALWPALQRGGRVATSGIRKLAGGRFGSGTSVQSEPTAPSEHTPRGTASWIRFSPPRLTMEGFQSFPRRILAFCAARWHQLPFSSKVFAFLTALLAISLVVSFFLLQKKRADDAQFTHASELLHEAQTKRDAAETALTSDNQDQARTLLREASTLAEELATLDLYHEQTQDLTASIAAVSDRLEKVLRITQETSRTVGDFSTALGGEPLSGLFFVGGRLYAFNPSNNTIAVLDDDGTVHPVSDTSHGIGYLRGGIAHEADKVLVLLTDAPGIAIFDTKTNTLQQQEISLPSSDAAIVALAPFGNRLYIYDHTTRNIYSYTKTLRGYSGGAPWITDAGFPRDTIVSMAIDGFVYTLHEDGTIRKLYKGAATDFVHDSVQPPLHKPDRLFTSEHLRHLYVLDRAGRRVVIFTKKGELVRQIFLESQSLVDVAVNADETILYVLDGTRVQALSLAE